VACLSHLANKSLQTGKNFNNNLRISVHLTNFVSEVTFSRSMDRCPSPYPRPEILLQSPELFFSFLWSENTFFFIIHCHINPETAYEL
jgi:hypothetical protein